MKTIYVLVILILVGCNKNTSDLPGELEDSYTLSKVGNVVFQIDSETKRFGNKMHFSPELNALCLFNEFNHSIYLYDIHSQELRQRIKIETQGPNGVTHISAFYVHNLDSIFTFSHVSRKLSVLNSKGEVILREQILEADEPHLPMIPNISYHNGTLYFSVLGYFNAKKELKAKSLFAYHIKSGDKQFYIDTPEEYNGDWGDKIALRFGTYVPDKRAFVSSWPMGSKLKVVDLATNEVNSYAYGSKRIHETKPFKDNQGDLQALRYYYSTNSWYQNIYYAPHQKVLLRSVSIGREIPVGEPLQGRYPSKNGDDIYVVIELFNNEFKKIGEVPNTVFYNDIFSTEDGIFITDYLHDEDNEDIISFLHYKFMPTTK